MAGLCEGGNEPSGSLKAIFRDEKLIFHKYEVCKCCQEYKNFFCKFELFLHFLTNTGLRLRKKSSSDIPSQFLFFGWVYARNRLRKAVVFVIVIIIINNRSRSSSTRIRTLVCPSFTKSIVF
ncbi:hypothetical protein ANN_19468 [Periplaneta americana]|uniref:Uncharacterized protein n=1 Tax=Periplaneta americana TaxID=6978 RepID=A0ABQ8SAA5_PERAM|nr:hypothetical protein ANN_19468 [Periplaneta americana]